MPGHLEATARYTWVVLERDEKQRQAGGSGARRTGADGDGGKVGKGAVCDPLLGSVEDVELAAVAQRCCRCDVGDVGAGALHLVSTTTLSSRKDGMSG